MVAWAIVLRIDSLRFGPRTLGQIRHSGTTVFLQAYRNFRSSCYSVPTITPSPGVPQLGFTFSEDPLTRIALEMDRQAKARPEKRGTAKSIPPRKEIGSFG